MTESSTTDTAKQQASEVADTASSAARDVAGQAKQGASDVVQETKAQTRGLLDSARTQVRDQAGTQQQRAADTLHSLSNELGSMASSSSESGPMTDLAHEASRRGGELAHWLQEHEPNDVLARVSSFARRRPVAFLAVCGVAGVLVGRLSRGAVASRTELDNPSGSSTPTTPAVVTAPAPVATTAPLTDPATAPATPALSSDEALAGRYAEAGPDFEQPRRALGENRSLTDATATEGWDDTRGDLGAGVPTTSDESDYGRGAAR